MKKKESVQEFSFALLRLIDGRMRYSALIDGVIKSVDETKFTCIVTVGDVDFFDVPLKVLISKQAGFIEVPKPGTNCILAFRDNAMGRPQLFEVHEAEKILVKCDNVVFNGGELGAMVTNKIVEKLNSVENDLNSLKQVFNSWVPVPQDGGAALKTASATWAGNQIQITPLKDVTNEKIKQ